MRRKVQLYIAGRRVDLGDDTWILYNWIREDMANPTALRNSSSHQVQLPGTCRNNGVFGAAFRLDRRTVFGARYDGTQFDPTRKTPFALFDDDGTVLESGYCRLDAVDTHNRRHAYTVTLYGGLGSFFYALAYKDDGTPRTLKDMIYQDKNGADVSDFSVTPVASDTVKDAWDHLSDNAPANSFWNVINFAPAYNGLPDDFDASHALMNDEWANMPVGVDEDGERGYEYGFKAGLDCALVNFSNPHTEWEMCDLRWYLQRPVISVKAFIAAVCDPRNNGGFTVTLDNTFFTDDNAYYAAAWWTLSMIASEDRTSQACLNNVLAASKSPMDYLVSFAKVFGLLFLWDDGMRSVRIVTRATFYDMGMSEGQTGETAVVPSSYDDENSTYYALADVSNAYADTTSANYAAITLVQGSGARTDFYFKFDFSNIPADAIIQSVVVKTKTQINTSDLSRVADKGQNVCIGTTPVGADAIVGTAIAVRTLDAGSGWTRAKLNDLAVHLYAIRGTTATSYGYTLRLYGASVEVVWTTPPTISRPVIDLTKRIDRGQPISQDPVLADSRWYQMGDGGKGQFAEQYLADYGRGYGVQRIDTGYEFDAGTKILTDGLAFKDAAEVSESNRMFSAAERVLNGRTWQRFFQLPKWEPVTFELWTDEGESKTFNMQCELDTTYWDNPDFPGSDWLPKLQLHDAANKGFDGSDVLVFFAGMEDTPLYTSGAWNVHKNYYLTEDSGSMEALAGGPCWDLTRTGIYVGSLPSFRRVTVIGRYIDKALEWGTPAVRAVPDLETPAGGAVTVYDLYWKAYLADRFAADTRVLKARVDLRGLPVGQALLRRFYWYDNALWSLNAIRNHSLTTWDLTECEFVKVQDMAAYTNGPGSVPTRYINITPDSASFAFLPGGNSQAIEVRSSSAWSLTASASPSWLSFDRTTGPSGKSTLIVTCSANTGTGRRSVTVTLTNATGESVSFTVTQAPGTGAGISLSPSSITIQAAGTAIPGQASRGRSSLVTASGAWAVDYSTVPAWLTVSTSLTGISLRAGANPGDERSASIKVYLTGDTTIWATLAVTQLAGEGGTGDITLLDGNGNDNATFQSTGGSTTLYVVVPEGDGWTITNSANWITVTPLSGAGNGTLAVTVPNYTGTTSRQGIITATRDGYTQGAMFYVIQNPATSEGDRIELTRRENSMYNSVEITAAAQGEGFDVRSNGAWTLATNTPWLHPTGNAWSGTGNKTRWFNADENTGSPRVGTIVGTLTATGQTSTFYVYQAGPGTDRYLNANFSKDRITANAQEVYLTISCPSGLAWSIDQISSGISNMSKTSGTGPDEITVQVSANTGSQRSLSCRIRNTTYGLVATPGMVQLSPSAEDILNVVPFGTVRMANTGGYQDFSVSCTTSWQVTTPANYPDLTISPTSGSGDGSVRVSLGPNPGTTQRTVTLNFATTNGSGLTQQVIIVQGAPPQGYCEVHPDYIRLTKDAQSYNVQLDTSAEWTASKNASWITVAASGPSGDGQTISIAVSENTGGNIRYGTVTFTAGGQTATVTIAQAPGGNISVDRDSLSFPSAGGSGSVVVFASGPWSVEVPSWLEVTPSSGSGSQNGETVQIRTKGENISGSAYEATLKFALSQFVYAGVAVSQATGSSLYVAPSEINVDHNAGDGLLQVTSNTSWEVGEILGGVTVTPSSGTGNTSVLYTYPANETDRTALRSVSFRTTDLAKIAVFTIAQLPEGEINY